MEREGIDAAIVGKRGQGNRNLRLGVGLMIFFLMFGCSYATPRRVERENIIQAPIAVVWGKTLQVLQSEKISIRTARELDYSIDAGDWWSDEIRIRLTSERPDQVILYIEISAIDIVRWVVWGHEERTMQNLYQKIRLASETPPS